MRSPSPKPALVTSTTGSPLRVRSALVATVVPTLTTSIAAPPPAAARIAATAASPGSPAPPLLATEGTLRTCSAPSGARPMTSVNVPPRSIQNCQPPRRASSDWLNVCIACIIRACERRSRQQRSGHARACDVPACGVLSRQGERTLGAQDLGARGGRALGGLRRALGRLPRARRAARARRQAGGLLQGARRGPGAGRLEPRWLHRGRLGLALARARRVPHGSGALHAGAAGAARRSARLPGDRGARLARRRGAVRAQRALRADLQGGAAPARERSSSAQPA